MSTKSGFQLRHASSTGGQPQPTARQFAPRKARVATQDIRARAYEIFRDRCGKGDAGDELSDWLRAEWELNGQGERQSRGESLLKGDQE